MPPRPVSVYDANSDGSPEVMLFDDIYRSGNETWQRAACVSLGRGTNRLLWACLFKCAIPNGLRMVDMRDVDNDGVNEIVIDEYAPANAPPQPVVVFKWDAGLRRYRKASGGDVDLIFPWEPSSTNDVEFTPGTSVDLILRDVLPVYVPSLSE